MSEDYKQVQEALERGVTPAELCSTCPWDRQCVSAPPMTPDQIKREREQAEIESKQREAEMRSRGENPGMGMVLGTLISTVLTSGKDIDAPSCPVFVVRLRSSQGRDLADSLRATMHAWDDSKVVL